MMTRGTPYRSNSRSKTARTCSVFPEEVICTASTKREYASRTVSGSQRCWSARRHQPLKSTVQTSFGAVATASVRIRACGATRRRRRVLTSKNPVTSAQAWSRAKLPGVQHTDLFRPPRRVCELQPHQAADHLLIRLGRTLVRSPAPIGQYKQTVLLCPP